MRQGNNLRFFSVTGIESRVPGLDPVCTRAPQNVPQDPISLTLRLPRGPHYTRYDLPNFTNHAFQVLGFQAGRRDWVIGGGAALFEHPDIAARFLGHA